jgi:isorenieratene synthase
VLATDVSGLQHILQASPSLHEEPTVRDLTLLRTTSVTVVRMVVGRRIPDTLSLFEGMRILDAFFNVTKLQGVQLDRYRDRTHEIVEVQIYRDRTIGQLSREALLDEIRADLEEVYGGTVEILEPVHVAVHRNVYSGYDVESDRVRPGTESKVPGLYFAGDWVQPDEGAWYMERAVRTGRLAARAILREDRRDPELVPLKPPVRTEWSLRSIAREGEKGIFAASRMLEKLLGLNETPL